MDQTAIIQFPFSEYSRLVGICNGILCWRHKDSFSLWNPSIRHKLSLPLPPNLPTSIHKVSLLGIGFGFDPIGEDYKIVWLSLDRKASFVYSVKTGFQFPNTVGVGYQQDLQPSKCVDSLHLLDMGTPCWEANQLSILGGRKTIRQTEEWSF
ncbi:hypothetical protein L2E82_50412 [Cichorium intybus]|nr:hypothetical protein L2E82_50412 [Cichorium intybus]